MTAIGVEIAVNTRVENLEDLRAQGFDAVLLATGTPRALGMEAPGNDLPGIHSALGFLRVDQARRATRPAAVRP